MPCMDGNQFDEERRLHKQATESAQLLCGLLRQIVLHDLDSPVSLASVFKDPILPGLLDRVPGLREWWAAHKLLDEARLEREREEANRETARQSALAKLTPEERKALGVQ